MDNRLNIKTTSDNKGVQDLTKALNDGTLTVKEYNKTVRELRDASKIGSQAQMDLKNVVAQVGQQTLTTNGKMMQSYFELGQSLRQKSAFAGFLSDGFQTLGMSQEKAIATTGRLGESLGGLQRNFMMISAGIAGFIAAFEGAEKAARLDLLQNTMASMASKEGVDFAKVQDIIRLKKAGVLSEAEMLNGAMKLSLMDIGWAKIPEMMDTAEKRSKMLGLSFEETLNLIERAAMGNAKALKGLLIPVTVEESYARFAKSIGVTTDLLNERGKRQAILNTVMEESEKKSSMLDKKSSQQVDTFERMKTSVTNLGIELGRLLGIFSPVIDAFTAGLQYLKLSISEITHLAAAAYNAFISVTSGMLHHKEWMVEATKEMDLAKKDAATIRDMILGRKKHVEVIAEETKSLKENNAAYVDQEKAAEKKKKALDDELKRKKSIEEMTREMQREEADAFNKGFQYLKLRQEAHPEDTKFYVEKLRTLQQSTKDETLQLEIEREIQKANGEVVKAEEKNRDTKEKILDLQYKLDDNTANYVKGLKEILAVTTDTTKQLELQAKIKEAEEKPKKQTKAQKEVGDAKDHLKNFNKEFTTTEQLMIDASYAVDSLTSKWTDSIGGLISGTMNIGEAFKSMGQAVIQEIEMIIAKMIAMKMIEMALSFLGLSGGGDVVSGGGGLKLSGAGTPSDVSFAASGGDFYPYGGDQSVIVGEKRAELMRVGRNGVRILPSVPDNHRISHFNQMGASAKGGASSGSSQMALAINALADKLTPVSESDIHYAMIRQARLRKGRTF